MSNKIKIGFASPYAGQELFIAVGILMVLTTLLKLLNIVYIDSDWYWFIAGLGLIVEGIVAMSKQRKFNKKFKVLTKEEYELLTKKE